MPRGRPKGSKNLSLYEQGKAKKIRESLAKNGITDFEALRDAQVLHNIYVNTDGEVFVKYEISRHPRIKNSEKKDNKGEKLIGKIEKNLAALRDAL
jgi:Flp pilus assembly CpaF family ATPase